MKLSTRHSETRPWGSFVVHESEPRHWIKTIVVSAGCRNSLQSHAHREEFWIVVAGHGSVVLGDQTLPAVPGAAFVVPVGLRHRMIAAPDSDMVIAEVALGRPQEDDIVRHEDEYGRAT